MELCFHEAIFPLVSSVNLFQCQFSNKIYSNYNKSLVPWIIAFTGRIIKTPFNKFLG